MENHRANSGRNCPIFLMFFVAFAVDINYIFIYNDKAA